MVPTTTRMDPSRVPSLAVRVGLFDAVEGWLIRRRVASDGVIEYSKTHEEIKGAFLTSQKEVEARVHWMAATSPLEVRLSHCAPQLLETVLAPPCWTGCYNKPSKQRGYTACVHTKVLRVIGFSGIHVKT